MTTYTAIPDADIDANSPVTATLMTLMRDNPIAITEKASGAPVLANGYVVEAMYAASSVDQTAMKTTTASQSVAVTAAGTASLVLTGGDWSMINSLSGTAGNIITFGNGNVAAGTLGFKHHDGYGSTQTVYVDLRYIQSSPPYGTADGPIPLFIYVEIELGTGKILGISVAPDPIWAYHGPTNISGQLSIPDTIGKNGKIIRLGKMIKKVRQIVAEVGSEGAVNVQLKDALMAKDKKEVDRIVDRLNTDDMVDIEITLDYKNSDMDVAPHPWMYNGARARAESIGPKGGIIPAVTGSEIVLLDPQNTEALLLLHEEGENILKMVEDGTIKIKNTELNRVVPNGMKAYGFNF